MNCPSCQTERLVMSERQGVEIDYCPKCRGVWLDRGELDKIVERSAQEFGSTGRPALAADAEAPRRKPDDSDDGGYRYKKRKHWLLEIFD